MGIIRKSDHKLSKNTIIDQEKLFVKRFNNFSFNLHFSLTNPPTSYESNNVKKANDIYLVCVLIKKVTSKEAINASNLNILRNNN